jgi:hypothetical protein
MYNTEQIVDRYYEMAGYTNVWSGFRMKSIVAVNKLISQNTNPESIISALSHYAKCYNKYNNKAYINVEHIFDIEEIKSMLAKNDKGRCDSNLIEENKFYYHKKLRIVPGLPIIKVDDSGEITRTTPKFFLEIVDKFTYDDMLEYFYDIHNVPERFKNYKRDIAGIKYLCNLYRNSNSDINWLDILLYMIDVSNAIRIDEDRPGLINVLDIQEYERQAIDILVDKINYENINGINKVVPRSADC